MSATPAPQGGGAGNLFAEALAAVTRPGGGQKTDSQGQAQSGSSAVKSEAEGSVLPFVAGKLVKTVDSASGDVDQEGVAGEDPDDSDGPDGVDGDIEILPAAPDASGGVEPDIRAADGEQQPRQPVEEGIPSPAAQENEAQAKSEPAGDPDKTAQSAREGGASAPNAGPQTASGAAASAGEAAPESAAAATSSAASTTAGNTSSNGDAGQKAAGSNADGAELAGEGGANAARPAQAAAATKTVAAGAADTAPANAGTAASDAEPAADEAASGSQAGASAGGKNISPAQTGQSDVSAKSAEAGPPSPSFETLLQRNAAPSNPAQPLPEPARALSSTLSANAHASAPQNDAPALPLSAPAIAVEIVTRMREGSRRFEIRLDPPELGRIEVRLDVDRNGHATTRLTVDRPETLDLLQRDARGLERALQSAGLKTDDGGLEFSLRQNGQGHEFGADRHQSPAQGRSEGAPREDETPKSMPERYRFLAQARGGVDIRI